MVETALLISPAVIGGGYLLIYRWLRLRLKRHEFDMKIKLVEKIYDSPGGATDVVKLANALDLRLSVDPGSDAVRARAGAALARTGIRRRPRALPTPGQDQEDDVTGAHLWPDSDDRTREAIDSRIGSTTERHI